MLTRLVHQVRIYAFGVLTTVYALVYQPLVYKALTNQGGVHQYIDPVVYLNTKDSHHHPKEYTIPNVFRAPGYNSLVLLN